MKVFLTMTMACIAAEGHGTESFAKDPGMDWQAETAMVVTMCCLVVSEKVVSPMPRSPSVVHLNVFSWVRLQLLLAG
jgi:hypothetical protein